MRKPHIQRAAVWEVWKKTVPLFCQSRFRIRGQGFCLEENRSWFLGGLTSAQRDPVPPLARLRVIAIYFSKGGQGVAMPTFTPRHFACPFSDRW